MMRVALVMGVASALGVVVGAELVPYADVTSLRLRSARFCCYRQFGWQSTSGLNHSREASIPFLRLPRFCSMGSSPRRRGSVDLHPLPRAIKNLEHFA
jgi:hypothetical protein